MGNCLFGGIGGDVNKEVIKVVTSRGGIMEFYLPITVESITDEFPGHGIFRSRDLFWKPLPHHELLLAGESYYLLPLNNNNNLLTPIGPVATQIAQLGHIRSNSEPPADSLVAPYRMSFDHQCSSIAGLGLKRTYTEAFSRYSSSSSTSSSNRGGGVWKVKLVISPEQLVEILSQEATTRELMESVRTVAKCGNALSSSSSSAPFSDQWSLSSSSRNASSSKKDGLLDNLFTN